jgi:hypothetical protein
MNRWPQIEDFKCEKEKTVVFPGANGAPRQYHIVFQDQPYDARQGISPMITIQQIKPRRSRGSLPKLTASMKRQKAELRNRHVVCDKTMSLTSQCGIMEEK